VALTTHPSISEVKGGVELYLYSPLGLSALFYCNIAMDTFIKETKGRFSVL
jgi:hypothetical protein